MTNKNIIYRAIDPMVSDIADGFGNNPDAIIEILREIQKQNYWIQPQHIEDLAVLLKIPASKVYGIATFYSLLSVKPNPKNIIRVCDGPVCWVCGGDKYIDEVRDVFAGNENWKVERSSCLGMCDRYPAALVNNQLAGPISIQQSSEFEIIGKGHPKDYTIQRAGELRVMLKDIGEIIPGSLDTALKHQAYQGLLSAIERNPLDIISEVETSGLTGRGGAGFPVGRKWRFVSQANTQPKIIICNADESEPLIFKDRVLIEVNPHQIIEGMAIAGYACGAQEGFIYIRGEYEDQADLLERSIGMAKQAGYLGTNIGGKNYNFDIHVHRGAGAYICGEETALIESLEGKRGEPRNRPPYPPTAGYLNLPTLVNNVESYAAIPTIIRNGAAWYRSLSSAATPGTKLYMLMGHINKPGLFEAPFGLTLRQVIEEYGGGMLPGATFNLALTGGAAGTIVSSDFLDIPIDYSSGGKGIALGAGAFLICDQRVSPIALLRNLMNFFRNESCGKCTPCRTGTQRVFEILNQMIDGKGQSSDVPELLRLADVMFDASFCGLGQSVPIPIRSAINNFPTSFSITTPTQFPGE